MWFINALRWNITLRDCRENWTVKRILLSNSFFVNHCRFYSTVPYNSLNIITVSTLRCLRLVTISCIVCNFDYKIFYHGRIWLTFSKFLKHLLFCIPCKICQHNLQVLILSCQSTNFLITPRRFWTRHLHD